MINIMLHQNVLFLAEVDQLGFWHSPKGSVSPASTFEWFDLSTVVQGGGFIAGMGTMTFDGGEGPDDYAVFVTTGGWAIVYAGGDPSLATEWQIIGRFPIGRPLGDRCVLETAGDVLVLTVNGFISMQQFMRLGGQQQRSYVFNDNIQPEIVRQAQTYANEFGWQAILVPELTLALFNVPQGSNTYVQYPVNTQIGAWSRFRGWDGCCWLQIDGNLLFGRADGDVHQANVGAVDVGNIPIFGESLTAFSDFGQRGRIKHFQMVRPILETSGDVTLSLGMAIDYDVDTRMPTLPTALPGANAAIWDVSEWNTGIWGGASQTRTDWYSIFELGYAAAIRIRISSTGDLVSWKSNDVSATLGGQL